MASRFKDKTHDERQYEDVDDEEVLSVFEEVRRKYTDDLDQIHMVSDNRENLDKKDPESMIKSAIDAIKGTHTTSCLECSQEIIIEDVSQFEVGQHLSMPGVKPILGKFYKHHAIVTRVISTFQTVAELELIHFKDEDKTFKITKTTEKYDLRKEKIYYIKYQHPRNEPDEVVMQAEQILTESKEKGSQFNEYDLLSCNCEHFATWCVVGTLESPQVQSFKDKIKNLLKSTLNSGGIIAKFVTRFALASADEITAGLQSYIYTTLANIFIKATVGVYLFYCILKTFDHKKTFEDGNMCSSCLKTKIINLWLGLGVFGITCGVSYLITIFVLPLLAYVGIPLLIILIVLSIVLNIAIPKIRRYLQSPFKAEKKKISSLSEVGVGDIISFSYYRFEHVGVVTELDERNHKVTCVHYALPTLFGTRVVQEDTFELDPPRQTVRLFDCNPYETKPRHKVVELARKRVGESKWSPGNRSDHLCYWAKYKNNARGQCENEADTDQLTASSLKTAFIRKEDVHLMSNIEVGDVVKYKKSRGIVVGIESLDDNYGREFEVEMIVYNSSYFFSKSTFRVDLNKDELTVFIYYPAYCFPMRTRADRAMALTCIGEKGKWWTNDGYISHCIMRKHQ